LHNGNKNYKNHKVGKILKARLIKNDFLLYLLLIPAIKYPLVMKNRVTPTAPAEDPRNAKTFSQVAKLRGSEKTGNFSSPKTTFREVLSHELTLTICAHITRKTAITRRKSSQYSRADPTLLIFIRQSLPYLRTIRNNI